MEIIFVLCHSVCVKVSVPWHESPLNPTPSLPVEILTKNISRCSSEVNFDFDLSPRLSRPLRFGLQLATRHINEIK